MATPVVVNGDKSLVLVDSRSLTAGQSAVILLSSIRDPGRVVTIRDSVGFLSSPQSIIVSTMSPLRFADGTSSVQITQPFSYLTVTSRDATSWNITNSFGFPQNESVANVFSLATNSVTTSNIYASGSVSTSRLTTASLVATSTAAVAGPLYVSSLVVAPPSATYQPFITDPGYAAYIQGNLKTFASILVDGSAQFTNSLSTGASFTINGNISTLGSLGVRGDIMTLGNVFAQGGGAFFRSLDIQSSATIGGPVTFSNALNINSNLNVAGTISSSALTTSTLRTSGSLQLGSNKFITARTNDILFSDPITAPSISTTNIQSSNAVVTANLQILNSIDARSASSFVLSSAAIENPAGRLLLSSIQTNNLYVTAALTASTLQTSSLTASTLLLSGNLIAPSTGTVTFANAQIGSLSTGTFTAATMAATAASASSLTTSTLLVSRSLQANNLSLFSASNVAIDNTGGSISSGTLAVQNLLIASTITTTGGIFESLSPTTNLQFIAPSVTLDNLRASTLYTSSLTTSTLTATRITIGGSAVPNINGPTFSPDTSLYTSTNVVISGGPGDYLTPFTISNVPPPGIGPTDPYPVEVSFRLNFNGPYLPGYYAAVPGLTLFPNGEATSLLSLNTLDDTSNVTNLYGYFGSNQTYTTAALPGGGLTIPVGTQPSSFFHLTGTMVGNSAFSFQFQSLSNAASSAVDSNAVITIQNGMLKWPYSLNGTTIENSLNDMTVRTLYYYGSLNFASDPALKEGVHDADLQRCADTVAAIPLVRYKFKDFYRDAFKVQDTNRLGILATDLEAHFPKSITYAPLAIGEHFQSTIRMVDTQQLEFAHLGATKQLLKRVEDLTSTLKGLQQEYAHK